MASDDPAGLDAAADIFATMQALYEQIRDNEPKPVDPDHMAILSTEDIPRATQPDPYGVILGAPAVINIEGVAMRFTVSEFVPKGQVYVFDTKALDDHLGPMAKPLPLKSAALLKGLDDD